MGFADTTKAMEVDNRSREVQPEWEPEPGLAVGTADGFAGPTTAMEVDN